MGALSHIRVCDFTGQLAGAGATRWLATFGAEVIRIEDPTNEGRWDILRGSPPFKDERRGIEFGSGFNNHNVNKLGVTIDARTEAGRELIADLVAVCDVVTENFAAGVLDRMGFGYERLRELKPDIIYVSNSGFGHTGPYRRFKSWGPIAQAVSGLTHQSGLAGLPPAGWGYSYLDHTGAYYMAMAVMMALIHRERTGEGQWVDLSSTEAGAYLHGTDLLDHTVNGRSLRSEDRPGSNRSTSPVMAPHGVYRCIGDDNWVAIACRNDADWAALLAVIGDDARASGLDDDRLASVAGRVAAQAEVDRGLEVWSATRSRWEIESDLQAAGVPAAAVRRPGERIDGDMATGAWGLWPYVDHPAMGGVRVDGQPVWFSKTNWAITSPAPTLGQHNQPVLSQLLGRTASEIERLEDDGVIEGVGGTSPQSPRAPRSTGDSGDSVGETAAASDHLAVTHPTPNPVDGPGPLSGIRVVEIGHRFCAFAGKLLADAGADVIVVEPPGGAEQRFDAPFVDPSLVADAPPDHELSLAWWAENTSKRSVVCDLETGPGRQFFRHLIAQSDVLLEAEEPGRLADLGLDYPDLAEDDPVVNAELVHVSVTPFGRERPGAGSGSGHDMTDLTILARGGPIWSCGYDDHALPPVRGQGNQGLRIAGHFAVLSTLTALLARPLHGGQFVDVSMVAAANVTTEYATFTWLASQQNVERQTGRHAAVRPSEPTQVECADGRYLNTGVPPRTPGEFAALASWLQELELYQEFPLAALLSTGAEYQRLTLHMIAEDPLAGEVFGAGREAMAFIASRLPAHEAFIGFQQRGIACGVIWSPDEMLTDPHFVDRGFPVSVHQPQLGRPVVYAGAPIRFTASPMGIGGPAPMLGQDTESVRREVG